MKKSLLSLLFLLLSANAFAAIAEVAGQAQGLDEGGSGSTLTFTHPLTTGNTIIIIVQTNGAGSLSISTPAQSAGTASLGTVSLDYSYSASGVGLNWLTNIYHAYVQTGGSCTIQQILNGSANIFIIDEFSGMSSLNPVYGSPVSNNGTSGAENPGSIVTPSGGMALMVSQDNSTAGNGSYTITGTNIYNEANSTFNTGQAEYLLTPTGGSHTVTATPAGGLTINYWIALGVAYQGPVTPVSSLSNITIKGSMIFK